MIINEKIKQLYAKVIEYFEFGNYSEAQKTLNKILKLDKQQAKAICLRGVSKFFQNKNGYKNDIDKALKFEPNNPFILTYRGYIYYSLYQYDKALKDIKASLKINPENNFAKQLLAVIYAKLGYFKKAINEYKKLKNSKINMLFSFQLILSNFELYIYIAKEYVKRGKLKKDNKDLFVHSYVTGMLHFLCKELKEAENCMNLAICLYSNCSELYSIRASCRKFLDGFSYEDAFEDYERAYILDPCYENLFELAKYECTKEYFDNLILGKLKYSEKFLDLEPSEEEAGKIYCLRGKAYMEARRYKEAIKDFTNAIKSDYNYIDIYLKRAQCYIDVNNHKKAIKDLNYVLDNSSDEEECANAYYLIAILKFYILKDYVGALNACDEVFKTNNADWYDFTIDLKATILYEIKDFDNAIECYKKIEEDGNSPYRELGEIYYEMKNYKEALKYLNKALKKGKDSKAFYIRSCVKREIGNFDGAEDDLQKYESSNFEVEIPYLTEGKLEYYRHNYANELCAINKEIKTNCNNSSLYLKRARINIACGKYIEVLNDLNTYIKSNNNDECAYIELARLKRYLGNIQGSDNDLIEAFNIQLEKYTKLSNPGKTIFLKIYRPINENTKSMLKQQYLWFSHPNNFNDPLDSRFYENAINDDGIKRLLSKVRIRSLSNIECSKASLLWSHYADSHKGIEIEYEIDINYLISKKIFLFPVEYSYHITDSLHPQISDYGKSFFVKSKEWEYEKEWRMVTLANNLVSGNELKKGFKLKSITFGLQVNKSNVSKIKKEVGNKCKYYKMIYKDKVRLPFFITKEVV